MGRKRKFVLIDPSFDGKGGDKWQYAMAFIDSARERDFEFTLLANIESPTVSEINGVGVDQRNIFNYSFYMHGDIVSRPFSGAKRRKIKLADAAANRAISDINAKIARSKEEEDHIGVERWTAIKAEIVATRIHAKVVEEAEADRDEPLVTPFNRDDFAIALARELLDLDLQKGDVVFLHTATQGMMESLSEISIHLDQLLDVDAYFLFHFGAEAPDARTFIDRYHSYSSFGSLALRLKTGSPFRRLFLLATSVQLRDELEAQFGVPVGLFEGLTNWTRYIQAVGGDGGYQEIRKSVSSDVRDGVVSLGVRIADLDQPRMEIVKSTVDLLEKQGFTVRVNLAFHSRNRAKAAQLVAGLDSEKFILLYTEENDSYIKFLVSNALILLPYREEVYRKRVSAVLHDCAVLGVSCVVPHGTPLADGGEYADVYVYDEIADVASTVLLAATALRIDPARSSERVSVAHKRFGSDVIGRLLQSMQLPSMVISKKAPIATVVMPLWGRVGSSYAIEAQIRFLLEAGYFVIQLLALDKAADQSEAMSYFWRMLYENSLKMRANIQRIAFREADVDFDLSVGEPNGFEHYLSNIGSNKLWDNRVESLTRQSIVTVVNHVFNSRLARRVGGGTFILETHDIQSRQMVHWPIRNPLTQEPESYDKLFQQELNEVESYDAIVNVSKFEHDQLLIANRSAKVITPHIPPNRKPQQYESISAMSYNHDWSGFFRDVYKFDFLLLGDSHPANVESAVWFIDEVFDKHLKDQSFTLGIVGRVCSSLRPIYGELEKVFYCGFVDDIADIRALSNVVVLPDRRGSGISIKTLETLAYGSPFVATDVAFRGLADRLPTPPRCFNEPEEFARELEKLAVDEKRRREHGEEAWKLYLALAGQSVFDGAWKAMFDELNLPIPINFQ
ncbi:glycosyltransferase family 4 protein [Rhizobium lusitanum]|uniref:Glycosyltransferase involved in cell wall biosynthesis n=1 Tax=Rhizobium lusitanum TaxID=293958 RepID=A0A7X0ITS8_9HYPH|nr:glycosyltransferase family 4 protein [Rhizobium lusitanum]MBB6486704.1 glycosyltransferase involved in cell wall biosynthesis [Rhizobium lusitanum]